MIQMNHGLIEILLLYLEKLERGLQKADLVLQFWRTEKFFGYLKKMDLVIFTEIDQMVGLLIK